MTPQHKAELQSGHVFFMLVLALPVAPLQGKHWGNVIFAMYYEVFPFLLFPQPNQSRSLVVLHPVHCRTYTLFNAIGNFGMKIELSWPVMCEIKASSLKMTSVHDTGSSHWDSIIAATFCSHDQAVAGAGTQLMWYSFSR